MLRTLARRVPSPYPSSSALLRRSVSRSVVFVAAPRPSLLRRANAAAGAAAAAKKPDPLVVFLGREGGEGETAMALGAAPPTEAALTVRGEEALAPLPDRRAAPSRCDPRRVRPVPAGLDATAPAQLSSPPFVGE